MPMFVGAPVVCGLACLVASAATDTTDADGLDFVTCICPDCDIEACGLHAETTTPGGTE